MYWKVNFTITILTLDSQYASSTQFMTFKINEPPYNGTCSIDLNRGYALVTYFFINCIDWDDIDGFIVRYEYFGNDKLNNL